MAASCAFTDMWGGTVTPEAGSADADGQARLRRATSGTAAP